MIQPNPSVYAITNVKNGMKYIGGASYPAQRWYEHKSALRLGTHRNANLQSDWNKYGENCFVFSILEVVSQNLLSEREDFYIKSCTNKYNVLNGFIGRKNSEAQTSAERGQTRTTKLNEQARAQGWDGISDYLTHILRGDITIPQKRSKNQ